ncbi:MAG: hypothetical protein ACTHU1_08740 [Arachnia sp.]
MMTENTNPSDDFEIDLGENDAPETNEDVEIDLGLPSRLRRATQMMRKSS